MSQWIGDPNACHNHSSTKSPSAKSVSYAKCWVDPAAEAGWQGEAGKDSCNRFRGVCPKWDNSLG